MKKIALAITVSLGTTNAANQNPTDLAETNRLSSAASSSVSASLTTPFTTPLTVEYVKQGTGCQTNLYYNGDLCFSERVFLR